MSPIDKYIILETCQYFTVTLKEGLTLLCNMCCKIKCTNCTNIQRELELYLETKKKKKKKALFKLLAKGVLKGPLSKIASA